VIPADIQSFIIKHSQFCLACAVLKKGLTHEVAIKSVEARGLSADLAALSAKIWPEQPFAEPARTLSFVLHFTPLERDLNKVLFSGWLFSFLARQSRSTAGCLAYTKRGVGPLR
jgi:hypothetical protein